MESEKAVKNHPSPIRQIDPLCTTMFTDRIPIPQPLVSHDRNDPGDDLPPSSWTFQGIELD